MKTKYEYLKEQGINLDKDFSTSTYTKIRFSMESFAKDFLQKKVNSITDKDYTQIAVKIAESGNVFCSYDGEIIKQEINKMLKG